MKKIFLIIIITALGCAPGFAQTYDSLAVFTNKTEFEATDIMAFQTKVSNAYTWRKITGANFWAQARDTTEGYSYAPLGSSNTFTGINTFNGATFGAGSHGTVTLEDSTVITGALWSAGVYPTVDDTKFLGLGPNLRWFWTVTKNITVENIYITDPSQSDSALFSYDGTNITADKPLNITEGITLDSASTFNVLNLEPHSYTIPSVGDTILTLTTSDLYSLIEIDLPGDLTPGISKFQIDTATKGMILKFYNYDALYTVIFLDFVANDDNLYMAGDFSTMGQYDYIEFLCTDATKGSQKWIETGRSNNVSP